MSRPKAAVSLLALLAGCGGDDPPRPDRPQAQTARHARAAPRPTPPERAPPAPKPVPRAPVRAEAIQEGPAKGRRIALTFDADMTPEMLASLSSGEAGSRSLYAREVIRALRRTRTRATLFITGLWARTYPRQVRSFARTRLFEIASHTWDHLAWTSDCYGLPAVQGEREKRREVRRTTRILRRLTGNAPRYFRFPGLCHEEEDLELVAAEGQQAIDGIASGDAGQSDPAVIERTVLDQVRPGAIVVMHMTGGPTAPATGAALARLIPQLRDRGYRLVTLTKLLEG